MRPNRDETPVIDGTLKQRSARAFLWSISDSIGVAAVSLASFVVLARMLDPRDFGAVALAGVFVYFFNLLAHHSFADALVQRAALEPQHLNTGFWGGLALATGLMLACQLAAGPLAALLGEPAVGPVLGWLAAVMPIAALSAVQTAMFRREMQFRWIAASSLAGRVGGVLALAGQGIMAVAVLYVAKVVLELPIHYLLLRRLLGIELRRYVEPLAAPLAASVPLAGAVLAVRWGLVGAVGDVYVLAACVAAGALTYGVAASLISPALSRTAVGLASRTPAHGSHAR
jgi:O-antigen/teichoic acid export membrane protein